MNYLIIEDDEIAARRLTGMIYNLRPSASLEACLISVESAIRWLENNSTPDLIFLDIQLADGLSFEIFEHYKIHIPVIFTTSFDDFALKAFRLNCVDYLIKPVNLEYLEKAIVKFESTRNNIKPTLEENNIHKIIEDYMFRRDSYKSRFLVPQHDGYLPVYTNNIAYFSAEDNCIMITTKDNQNFSIHYTLDKLERELDPELFWRVNRSFIVSAFAVKKAYNFFNYKIKLELKPATTKDVVISRSKVSAFKQWFNN